MRTVFSRIAGIVLFMTLAVISMAANLVVTSPTEGSYLGSSNTLKFNITGATVEVTVTATVTADNGSVTTFSDKFTPDSDGKISGSMSLNFSESSFQGGYTIVVHAAEPGQTYSDVTVHATVDAVAPKFLDFNPVSGRYVGGAVQIRATIKESNIKDWRVQVNGQDIPNNTGSTNTVSVDWATTGIQHDGSQSITIKARDLANNETTQTISVTLDRVPPVLTIAYPTSNTKLIPGTAITVLIDISDASSSSIDWTGMDVVAKRLDGTFIARISRVSFKSSGSTSNRWTGRIQYKAGLLPASFKIVATASDKAGNSATAQEVTVTIGRKR